MYADNYVQLEKIHSVQTFSNAGKRPSKMPYFAILKNEKITRFEYTGPVQSQNLITISLVQCQPFRVIWFKSTNNFCEIYSAA